MKRILIIGSCPLPDENTKTRPAAGLRTYQFLKPLLKNKGFNIRLVTIAMPECYGADFVRKEEIAAENFARFSISKNDTELIPYIQKIHDDFSPEVIISVNTYPSYIASLIKSKAPLWADLNGWIMAEAQAQAYKLDSNDYLPHHYKMERIVIKRADKFSTVSEAQKFALLGELALMGRLNNESFNYQFAHYIPNGIEWFEDELNVLEDAGRTGDGRKTVGSSIDIGDGVSAGDNKDDNSAVQTLKNVPKGSFILLWVGGYNTWADEWNLFKGVEDAMKVCDKLYFVSTGGEIEGLDNKTFAKFKKLIEESPFKDRFVFLGWVDTADIPLIYKRASCGINVDKPCIETFTGARNRINEMMKYGLPLITTLGSEISYEVAQHETGIAVKSGDHGLVTDAICALYQEWRGGFEHVSMKFKEFGRRGIEYIKDNCNYDKTTSSLIKWLENPRSAPDRDVHLKLDKMVSLQNLRSAWRYLKENGFKKSFKKFLQKTRLF
jgi:glycosyltransferase involved in cell wall biosynthesis